MNKQYEKEVPDILIMVPDNWATLKQDFSIILENSCDFYLDKSEEVPKQWVFYNCFSEKP